MAKKSAKRRSQAAAEKSRQLAISLLLVAAAVVVAILILKRSGPSLMKSWIPPNLVAPSAQRQTSLRLSPSQLNRVVGQTTIIALEIETGRNRVTGVEFYLTFDPAILRVVDIAPGSFLTKPTILLKKIDYQKGQVAFAVGSLSAQSGSGILASLTVVPIQVSQGTELSFSSDTKVAALGEGSNNMLKSQSGATITILAK